VLTASEEAMAVLEEVVLYAFQQCVYYLSKVRAACAPHCGAGHWGSAACEAWESYRTQSCGRSPVA
jgi:hypothetical protein